MAKAVPFDVVEIWYNDVYRPYSFTPDSPDSLRCFAIRVGDDVFYIGNEGMGVYICDDLDTP